MNNERKMMFSKKHHSRTPLLTKCSECDVLDCKPILEQLTPEQLETTKTVKYTDIYNCLEIQKVTVTVYSWLLNIRERLLEAAIPASGTSLVAASCLGGIDWGLSVDLLFCKIHHHVNIGPKLISNQSG